MIVCNDTIINFYQNIAKKHPEKSILEIIRENTLPEDIILSSSDPSSRSI